jgi:Tol biopolymer transport system component
VGSAKAQFQFAPATSLISPSVGGDKGPSLSSDNLTLFFHSRVRPGGLGSSDIWIATRPEPLGLFGAAVNVGSTVNSTFLEAHPKPSLDGLSLYFTSNRPGGQGVNDLWMTTRATTHDAFGTPVNLGPGVNTSFEEYGADISADGLTILFSREPPGSVGTPDIYMATRPTTAVPFGAAVNLGSPINTSGYEYQPSLSNDGLALFFTSDRANPIVDVDFWVSTRASLAAPWGTPVRLGPNVNGAFLDETGDIAWDGSSFVFDSTRDGGDYHLYQALAVPEPSTPALAACGLLLAGLAA